MVFGIKFFCEVVSQIFFAWMPSDVDATKFHLDSNMETLISMAGEHCFLLCHLQYSQMCMLSQYTVVGGWAWPSYSSATSCSILPSWML